MKLIRNPMEVFRFPEAGSIQCPQGGGGGGDPEAFTRALLGLFLQGAREKAVCLEVYRREECPGAGTPAASPWASEMLLVSVLL